MTQNDAFQVGKPAHEHFLKALDALERISEDKLKVLLHEFMAGIKEVEGLSPAEIEVGVLDIAREEGVIELIEDEGY